MSHSTAKYIKVYFQEKSKNDLCKSETMCSNYRPVSILPIISKVFEKLIHKRLYDFIKKIPYGNEFGFQEGKSTERTILDLYTNISQSVEKQEKSSYIFLDFAKAFDTVDHYILIRYTRTLRGKRHRTRMV